MFPDASRRAIALRCQRPCERDHTSDIKHDSGVRSERFRGLQAPHRHMNLLGQLGRREADRAGFASIRDLTQVVRFPYETTPALSA